MTLTTDMLGRKAGEQYAVRPRGLVRLYGVAIWTLMGLIFLFDVLTPGEIVSIGFMYTIPIFIGLFELKPRPFLYAGTASALSLAALFLQPSSELATGAIVANRLIADGTLWMSAILVRLQYLRHHDAQKGIEVQRRFVDILSHEVGTALTTITGQAYRISKLCENVGPSDLQVRAEKIRRAAERIETIVSRVQFASSLGDGTIPIARSLINLNVMVQQLVDQLREERRGASMTLSLPPEPQVIGGDEMLIRQLLENVIVNAIKYSPAGTPIFVGIGKRGSASRIRIADQGIGIPDHELPKVRSPYYRGQSSRGTSGTGLGLYLVERIVEAHGGRLAIESEVGKGTSVIIDLPANVNRPVS